MMKFLILVIVWCILFVLFWPLAVLVLVAAPVLWLISLPIRLVGLMVEAGFSFLRGVLMLPARLLGHKA